jgi:CRP/FNR family cyclic AMP-dependent transcriptional regulator
MITSISKNAMLAMLATEPRLLLANFGKEGGGEPIPVTLSQETPAEMIGTTRSRVSFLMKKFRKKGFIDYNGKIEVHRTLLDALLRDKPQIQEHE